MSDAGTYLAALLDHAAEELDPLDEYPGPTPTEAPEEQPTGYCSACGGTGPASCRSCGGSGEVPAVPARFGSRRLDAASVRAIDATTPTTGALPPVRVWASSPAAAVKRWADTRDHGASLRSTCDPDRANRVQTSTDQSLGGREHDAIERVRTVSRAIDRAEADLEGLRDACAELTPRQCRAVFLLRIVGEQRVDHVAQYGIKRKGTFERRDQLSYEQLVELVREHVEVTITAQDITAICSHFLGRVRADLVASGEMRGGPAPARRGFAADPGARIRGA